MLQLKVTRLKHFFYKIYGTFVSLSLIYICLILEKKNLVRMEKLSQKTVITLLIIFMQGDQASIVGGAIQFVKELEHLLQSLEVQKLQLVGFKGTNQEENMMDSSKFLTSPFSQFFAHPQYGWSLPSNKHTAKTQAAMADIEVTLIETHANLRILTRRRPKQLVKLVTGLQTLKFTILHLNVTTMDPLVLYSANVKVIHLCYFTYH